MHPRILTEYKAAHRRRSASKNSTTTTIMMMIIISSFSSFTSYFFLSLSIFFLYFTKANVKHKVASTNFLKLSLLYVKKVGPHHFYNRKSGPCRKKFGHPCSMVYIVVSEEMICLTGLSSCHVSTEKCMQKLKQLFSKVRFKLYLRIRQLII